MMADKNLGKDIDLVSRDGAITIVGGKFTGNRAEFPLSSLMWKEANILDAVAPRNQQYTGIVVTHATYANRKEMADDIGRMF